METPKTMEIEFVLVVDFGNTRWFMFTDVNEFSCCGFTTMEEAKQARETLPESIRQDVKIAIRKTFECIVD